MAKSHLLSHAAAVNDPAHPETPRAEELLQAVQLGCYAALIVERIAQLIAQDAPKLSRSQGAQFDSMHHDVYDALHSAIEQLASAPHIPSEYRDIGRLLGGFFSAESSEDQMLHHNELIRHLEQLNACSNATVPSSFGVIRNLFVHLSKSHRLDPDDMAENSIARSART